MPNMYPVALHLEGRLCAVVGAGKVGQRKVLGLLDAGAIVRVIGFEPTAQIQCLANDDLIELSVRGFDPSDLEGCCIAFAATDDERVNDLVGEVAKRLDILFCSATGGEGDFMVPAVLNRGHLQVAISTRGASPTYARLLRDYLEGHLVADHAELLAVLNAARNSVKKTCAHDAKKRHQILTALTPENMIADVQAGNLDQVKIRISQCLSLLQD